MFNTEVYSIIFREKLNGMLQVVFMIAIGRIFYELASKNNRNKWLVGALAAFSFLALQFVFGFLYMMVMYFLGFGQALNEFLLSIIAMALTMGVFYAFHRYLKKRWEGGEIGG